MKGGDEMISAIGTASAGSHSIDHTAKLAELKKRASALQQQLTQNRDTKPEELASLRANSISQDISSVQAQIEKAVLEFQLNRLPLVSDVSAVPAISTVTAASAASATSGDAAAAPAAGAALVDALADAGNEDRDESFTGSSGADGVSDAAGPHSRSRRSHGRLENGAAHHALAAEAYLTAAAPASRLNIQA